MRMEGTNNANPGEGSPKRTVWTNEASLKFAVDKITITGRENIKEIPKGAKVVALTTHMTDLDVPLAINAIMHDLPVSVMNLSTHHKFWGPQGEPPTYVGLHIMGIDNFKPIDFHKDEAGKKSPRAFNPENFKAAIEDLDAGKCVVLSAHNPAGKPMQSLEGVKGGYGGIYLAMLTDAYILPVTALLDKPAGMYEDNLKLKTLLHRPNASVAIGKPFKIEKIEGIEHFDELAQKIKSGDGLSTEEEIDFKRMADALREKSKEVMKLMSEQLETQK